MGQKIPDSLAIGGTKERNTQPETGRHEIYLKPATIHSVAHKGLMREKIRAPLREYEDLGCAVRGTSRPKKQRPGEQMAATTTGRSETISLGEYETYTADMCEYNHGTYGLAIY